MNLLPEQYLVAVATLLGRCREDPTLADLIPVLTEILQYELHNQVPPGEGLLARLQEGTFQKVGIPVDRDRSFWFIVTGDSGLS